jgi:enamine deaminase RidA (YjgF/YER057c/UK114 family)
MKITRQHSATGDVVTLERGALRERYITGRHSGANALAIFNDFPPASGNIAMQLVFGGCGFHDAARAKMAGAGWPLLWVQGDVCSGSHVAGLQAFVLDGIPVQRIHLENGVVGTMWSDDDADYCLLAGILPLDVKADRYQQTRECFERIEAGVKKAGMDFSHVVRTWFFLDHLLDWYDVFNKARTTFFNERGVFEHLVPASTGIGAGNPAGAALSCGALAIRPKQGQVSIEEVCSPLQCPATAYRSSFARAVEIGYPDRRQLIISGTASIAPEGETLYEGDVVKQIHLTLDVIEAILKSRGMDWPDTVRAVGYFHDITELPQFNECLRARGIAQFPMAPAHATVCRHDLLFEMELDAIVPADKQTSCRPCSCGAKQPLAV